MVEFCDNCKTSLPKADLTIAGGEIFLSHDYVCPFCKEPAAPRPVEKSELPLPSDSKDVLIASGKAETGDPMTQDSA